MDEWRKKTLSELQKHGYAPLSVSEFDGVDSNTVVQAECESADLVVKWFSDDSRPAIPNVGSPEDKFTGGWFIQNRLSNILDVNIPEVIVSKFSDEYNYYVMEEVDNRTDDELWFLDTYLLRICREIGSILSEVHGVSASALGGIPGKQTDPSINMRRFAKEVENTVSDTPYMAYSKQLDALTSRYEELYNPQSTCLVHGSLVVNNIMTDEDGVVTGLIDWDESMYADPLFDIAFFQAQVCDVFGIFSPWSIETLRETVEESYSHAINNERLEILRVLIHLNTAAKVHDGHFYAPWKKIAKKSEMTRQEIHRERFELQMEDVDVSKI